MTNSTKKPPRAQGAPSKKAAFERKNELANLMESGQLMLWPETERGVPNELLRCAIFSARNRNTPREVHRANAPLLVPVIGGGEIRYIGEELRQDDETVWMQCVHMSKDRRSPLIMFTPHSFLLELKWPIKDESYTRLLNCLRRLTGGLLEVYSRRFDVGLPTRLLHHYTYSERQEAPWSVTVYDPKDNLLRLFDDLYESRLNWETRLNLPDGVTTWLHGFFCSHREPFGHKVETLAIGAGLKIDPPEDAMLSDKARTTKRKERIREAKKLLRTALQILQDRGFLSSWEITKGNIVNVVRAPRHQLRAPT
ncbi:TrfA family protein [Pelomonas sp. HMWF004]|nr:TrfA family protein [Pelomonas sp. HMWF004]